MVTVDIEGLIVLLSVVGLFFMVGYFFGSTPKKK